jgi:hypothetical protein
MCNIAEGGKRMTSTRRRARVSLIVSLVFFLCATGTLNAEDCDYRQFAFTKKTFMDLENRYADSLFLVNCGGPIEKKQNIGTGF